MEEKLEELRKKHPVLRYTGYFSEVAGESLHISYEFVLEPDLIFRPRIEIPLDRDPKTIPALERMIFLYGMVELLSYWKVACPEKILVECGTLSEYEIKWWEYLIRNGLGEFFYQNQISPAITFQIICAAGGTSSVFNEGFSTHFPERSEDILVLVGGGKDSIVSLECIRKYSEGLNKKFGALCLNPIQASLDAIALGGYDRALILKRSIDPGLYRCNKEGYLNGHTPFSAMLSFASSIAALCNGFSFILASNESSASEGNTTYHGFEINHQYSKSYSYEKCFREYLEYSNVPVSYLSFLRPLNEIQIAGLFSMHKQYHTVFRSCNVMQTRIARGDSIATSWCGSCPKCVFTFICLSPFLSLEELKNIFGDIILYRSENQEYIRDLLGKGSGKPFECVGTPEEVTAALSSFINRTLASGMSQVSSLESLIGATTSTTITSLLTEWNAQHFLPEKLAAFLKNEVENLVRTYEP